MLYLSKKKEMRHVIYFTILSVMVFSCEEKPTKTLEEYQAERQAEIDSLMNLVPDHFVYRGFRQISGLNMYEIVVSNTAPLDSAATWKEVKEIFNQFRKIYSGDIQLYTDTLAIKANYSSSFSEKHPGALQGFIGQNISREVDYGPYFADVKKAGGR